MDLRIGVICASNQNRSMEAHRVLSENGYKVRSFGTGTAVRLPGPSADRPNVYNFGSKYDAIYQDLVKKDEKLYTQNGLLSMVERNRKIKEAPERFQDELEPFDLLITCEDRCFDAVCEELMNRPGDKNIPCHVINVQIRDNHEDACIGAKHILDLVNRINESSDVLNDISNIVEEFESSSKCSVLHALLYY